MIGSTPRVDDESDRELRTALKRVATTLKAAGVPFALAGGWTYYLVCLSGYAAISLFVVQYLTHRVRPELTTH